MLKKFERRRSFSFLFFFPVFVLCARAQQTLAGIAEDVMDVSAAVISSAGCGIFPNGPRLGRITWLTASFFGTD
jgi:hypothetical protein